MNLKAIDFIAFRSLINEKLIIENNCIGLVGINESGKSNILKAINSISAVNNISKKDIPKMSINSKFANISYIFSLEKSEHKQIKKSIKKWISENSNSEIEFDLSEIEIEYNIKFNKENNSEIRKLKILNFELPSDFLVLKQKYSNDGLCIMIDGKSIPISETKIIQSLLVNNDSYKKENERINKIQVEIKKLEKWLETKKKKNITKDLQILDSNISDDPVKAVEQEEIEEKVDTKTQRQIEQVDSKIESLNTLKDQYLQAKREIDKVDLDRIFKINIENIEKAKEEIKIFEEEVQINKTKLDVLNEKEVTTDSELSELESLNKSLSSLGVKISNRKKKIGNIELDLKHLKVPIEEKFANDVDQFNSYMSTHLHDELKNLIPPVIFWEHKESYILPSETIFSDLLKVKSVNKISRPLFNIFRIGLDVDTIDSLHVIIRSLIEDPNERSRLDKRINKRINEYLLSVWKEYDQRIKITLETEKIRIEIFDPQYDDASYYNMEERSQGAQTFLSFLLTIGAEAKKGVIKNTVLLLDEPESHLHPSGVRFLRDELIKISKQNVVIFATHSVFMIDEENYNRHIIISKKDEKTKLTPSFSDRIGYFMQEEVLYSSLDINLNKEIADLTKYNFVFEGDGDVNIFKYFLKESNLSNSFPDNQTSFYHGGGCNNIIKYLKNRPIQLGSKWIFVLDKDKPAQKVVGFLNGKYKAYIDKDIFIFQYNKKSLKMDEFELEDLMENDILIKALNLALESVHENKITQEFDNSDLFNVQLKNIIDNIEFNESCNKELIKGIFKEKFNSLVKTTIKDESKNKISEMFNIYSFWFKDVITKLSKTTNESDTTDNTG